PATFRRDLADRLIASHPYFFALCQSVLSEPLLIPEYSEEDLGNFKNGSRSWINALAEDAAQRMRQVMDISLVSDESVATRVRDGLAKRFPAGSEPKRKEVLDAVLDSLVVAALDAKGLRIDAITFDTLMKWGTQLF